MKSKLAILSLLTLSASSHMVFEGAIKATAGMSMGAEFAHDSIKGSLHPEKAKKGGEVRMKLHTISARSLIKKDGHILKGETESKTEKLEKGMLFGGAAVLNAVNRSGSMFYGLSVEAGHYFGGPSVEYVSGHTLLNEFNKYEADANAFHAMAESNRTEQDAKNAAKQKIEDEVKTLLDADHKEEKVTFKLNPGLNLGLGPRVGFYINPKFAVALNFLVNFTTLNYSAKLGDAEEKTFSESKWGMTPSIEAIYHINSSMAAFVGVGYNYLFSGEEKKADDKSKKSDDKKDDSKKSDDKKDDSKKSDDKKRR